MRKPTWFGLPLLNQPTSFIAQRLYKTAHYVLGLGPPRQQGDGAEQHTNEDDFLHVLIVCCARYRNAVANPERPDGPMKALVGIFLLFLSGAVAPAQDYQCNHEQSQLEIQKLTDAGAIVSIDRFPPYVTVVVEERRWSRSNFDAKKAIAQHVDCATAGPDNNMLRTVIFRSNGDSRKLGTYSRNELKIP